MSRRGIGGLAAHRRLKGDSSRVGDVRLAHLNSPLEAREALACGLDWSRVLGARRHDHVVEVREGGCGARGQRDAQLDGAGARLKEVCRHHSPVSTLWDLARQAPDMGGPHKTTEDARRVFEVVFAVDEGDRSLASKCTCCPKPTKRCADDCDGRPLLGQITLLTDMYVGDGSRSHEGVVRSQHNATQPVARAQEQSYDCDARLYEDGSKSSPETASKGTRRVLPRGDVRHRRRWRKTRTRGPPSWCLLLVSSRQRSYLALGPRLDRPQRKARTGVNNDSVSSLASSVRTT